MTTTRSEQTGVPVGIRGVHKRYADSVALEDVSLDIRAGEFITLLGASGSGKSTLLNIIAGFIEPTAGSIAVDGADITRIPPHRRGLGMVFQHYALFPHMSVADNVAFPLRRRRTPKPEVRRRVQEALDTVELGHLGARRPAELSGGQHQRVAFARAIVSRPRVLLMDEPLGALDKMLREQLQLEIRRLHQELGITFVFVTHDQDEALAMSDRIALLRHGRIVQVGTPQELYDRPNCRYTAEFIGASNVLHGRADDGLFAGAAGKGALRLPPAVPDGPMCLVLRPERVRLALEERDVPVGCDSLAGTVEEVTYLGSSRRVQVRTGDGTPLVVHGDVPRGVDALTLGVRVHAFWQVADVTVVADEPDREASRLVAEGDRVPA